MTDSNAPSSSAPASPAPAGQPSTPGRQEAPGGTDASVFDGAVRRDAAAHAQRAESMSASEIRAEAKRLRDDPKSALWKGEGEEHAHAVAVNYRAHELDAEAAGEQGEPFTTTMMLANRAISIGDLPLSPSAREAVMRDPRVLEQDTDMTNLVRYADRENISTPVLKEMFTSWANALAASGGVVTEQVIAGLKREFEGRLHPAQAKLLEKWLRLEVAPNLAKLRRRG
jgi:hypothetical protein